MSAPPPLLSYDLHGAEVPRSPVVLSVPHAGRAYPAAMIALLRVPVAALLPLEDRHVDAVVLAARAEETALVARLPRAWIDLNRSETERDPRVEHGARRTAMPVESAKLKSGLGLVPRRAGSAGDIWASKLTAADVDARIAADHRPYHAALGEALAAARQRFGFAVLLDVHSMPPLTGAGAARVVIGDRFGRSADARLVDRIAAEAQAMGLPVALNTPYAGGYVLERHARPREHIHAIQLELCRGLYLDAARTAPGPGLAATARLVRRMIDGLADAWPVAAAAE